jgi:hypothetical protein
VRIAVLASLAQREGDSPIRREPDLVVSERRAQPVTKQALSPWAIALLDAQIRMYVDGFDVDEQRPEALRRRQRARRTRGSPCAVIVPEGMKSRAAAS